MSQRIFPCLCGDELEYHNLDSDEMECDRCECDRFVENIPAQALR